MMWGEVRCGEIFSKNCEVRWGAETLFFEKCSSLKLILCKDSKMSQDNFKMVRNLFIYQQNRTFVGHFYKVHFRAT